MESKVKKLGFGALVALVISSSIGSGIFGIASDMADTTSPGAGTFMMLAFTTLAGFDLLRASGNTKVVNSASNAASLVTFALAGQVVWAVGIPAALCNILGSYIGSGLALKGGAKIIRPMFFVVLALLAVKLITDLI